jgi:hypothetical protein
MTFCELHPHRPCQSLPLLKVSMGAFVRQRHEAEGCQPRKNAA